jgi:hypothetical protein
MVIGRGGRREYEGVGQVSGIGSCGLLSACVTEACWRGLAVPYGEEIARCQRPQTAEVTGSCVCPSCGDRTGADA